MKADFSRLDRAFAPQCVAVVGDKPDFKWLRGQSQFKGKLYSVQINPRNFEKIKAMGVDNYTSLSDIPEPVDLVIVAVPRAVAPQILDDCVRKGVAAAHVFTSGYSETGTEEGVRLERLLKEQAEQTGLHLIGPNCLGFFNPAVGLKQVPDQYSGTTGPVGFISQSGNHAVAFSMDAHLVGLDLSKSVSFGGGIVLDSADFLEYFGQDPGIKVIGMYVEGVKDGRRFLSVLREVAARKPVVVWKGGRTEDGERAAVSHTGSLAVSQTTWDSVMRQCGAIKVNGSDAMVDTVKALVFLLPVQGNRVGVTGGSGGQSVEIADVFAEAGPKVPLLTQKSYAELASFFNLVGASYRNPIDTGNMNRGQMKRILEILEQDDNVDNLVLLVTPRMVRGNQLDSYLNALIDVRRKANKPVMAFLSTLFSSEETQVAREVIRKLQGAGIPVFGSFQRGARALRNAHEYYEFKRRTDHGTDPG
ncbi:MAG: CoA-binding protein [Chloroflexi bacterium]|nr:CoA-binding protein [Chloroflexota bacterium]